MQSNVMSASSDTNDIMFFGHIHNREILIQNCVEKFETPEYEVSIS